MSKLCCFVVSCTTVRNRLCSTILILAALIASTFAMTGLRAGVCGNPCGVPCAQCQPCSTCAVQPCQCTQPRPQVSYRQQVQSTPTVTYKDVTRTQYRMQPQTVAVPVTTYRQVTVDQGQWQKIWVPKPVTKQIPQTVYQQRTTYRQVPYQVTQRVPQVSYRQTTTMVPTVSYRQPVTTGCNTCGTIGSHGYHNSMTASPAYSPYNYGTPVISSYPSVYPSQAAPVISSLPPIHSSTPTIAYPTTQPIQLGREIMPLDRRTASATSDLNPVPDPRYLDTPRSAAYDEWPSKPRTATRVEPRTTERQAPVRTTNANSRFVPAPSAISVWRTRDTRVR
jgi:hypothetical protein